VGFLANLFAGGGKGAKRVDVAKRFDLRRRSGQGTMSKVHLAYDRDLGRTVCLKVLDKTKTRDFEARFSIQNLKKPPEGEICVALKHTHIVTTYEHGITTDGSPYLVMEWIDGDVLNHLISDRSPKLEGKRSQILLQVTSALEYMHQTHWLHRDICPRNVMLTQGEFQVKLIDFGLTLPYKPEFCRPGNRTGNPDYMAPELMKRQTTDHRVDLFSLGVTAYETYTNGGLPWEKTGAKEEKLESFRRRLNNPPRDPRLFNGKLDDATCRILLKSIARDPSERYQSAAEFRDALRVIADKGL
jgi:serine/threonine protein kinase